MEVSFNVIPVMFPFCLLVMIWVVRDEPAIVVDFQGMIDYANLE